MAKPETPAPSSGAGPGTTAAKLAVAQPAATRVTADANAIWVFIVVPFPGNAVSCGTRGLSQQSDSFFARIVVTPALAARRGAARLGGRTTAPATAGPR